MIDVSMQGLVALVGALLFVCLAYALPALLLNAPIWLPNSTVRDPWIDWEVYRARVEGGRYRSVLVNRVVCQRNMLNEITNYEACAMRFF